MFWLKEAMQDGQLPLAPELLAPVLPGAIEERFYRQGYKRIAGLDEVGRGPLAGPVVAAAVVFPHGFLHSDIKDSKLLTRVQREKLVPCIKQSALGWGIGVVEVEEIDRINILNASLRAMAKALAGLRPFPDCLLVDGDQIIPGEFLDEKIPIAARPLQRTVVKGDRACLSIAAASILAKVTRDEVMVELDAKYPQYGFAQHKGYASVEHLEALRRHGPSAAHRHSFKPVRDLCPTVPIASLPLWMAAEPDE